MIIVIPTVTGHVGTQKAAEPCGAAAFDGGWVGETSPTEAWGTRRSTPRGRCLGARFAGYSGFVAALAFRIASLFQVSRRLRVVASPLARSFLTGHPAEPSSPSRYQTCDLAIVRSKPSWASLLIPSGRASLLFPPHRPWPFPASSLGIRQRAVSQARPPSLHPSIDLILQRPLPRCCHRFGNRVATRFLVPTSLFHTASPVFSADHRVTPGFPPLQAVEDSAGLLHPAADPRVRPVSPSPRWSPPRR